MSTQDQGSLARQSMAFVLAGGRGSRLKELTDRRAKPAVFFGGKTRIIDFALSNSINSGIRRISVATQYKAHSLIRHLHRGWSFFRPERNESMDILPASQRVNEENWYLGTADAVYQNIDIVESYAPKYMVVLAGDHIYKQDYSKMLEQHVATAADVTVGCIEASLEEAKGFGVMAVDTEDRITEFVEKPANPPSMPGDPDQALCSMGIYVFETQFLFEILKEDAADPDSSHDFGKDIIPSIIQNHLVRAWPFMDKQTGEPAYWKDVGTLDSYYETNMDLISIDPQCNLYDESWPIRSFQRPLPPPKFVFNDVSPGQKRVGQAVDSMVCPGSIISGGTVERSILGPSVRTNSYAEVRDSILHEGVQVGRSARIRRAIIDKQVQIPEGMRIGYDADEDRRHGLTVTESGIVAVPKNARFDRNSNVMKPHIGRFESQQRPVQRETH